MAKKKTASRKTLAKRKASTKKKTTTTALVRRHPQAPAKVVQGDDMALGQLGRVQVNITKAERECLARPVVKADVRIKPTGAIYLSHPSYTRWLNEAFGVGSWMIVPVGQPKLAEKTVAVPYILHIKGKEAAQAWGEQEYFSGNRQQTYGDAIESTVASALRRCCKRLGMALELWEREWADAFVASHCTRVKVKAKKDGKTGVEYWWRRTDATPFWNEVGPAGRDDGQDEARFEDAAPRGRGRTQQRRSSSPPPTPAGDGRGAETIPEEAQRRLWRVARNAGREEPEVVRFLKRDYGVSSTKEIRKADYEAICEKLESPGELNPLSETDEFNPTPLEGELVD